MSKEHTMPEIDPRDYGRLEAEVAHLNKKVDSMEADIKAMRALMEQAKGGWRTLALLGGISATVGAAVTWVTTHVSFLR